MLGGRRLASGVLGVCVGCVGCALGRSGGVGRACSGWRCRPWGWPLRAVASGVVRSLFRSGRSVLGASFRKVCAPSRLAAFGRSVGLAARCSGLARAGNGRTAKTLRAVASTPPSLPLFSSRSVLALASLRTCAPSRPALYRSLSPPAARCSGQAPRPTPPPSANCALHPQSGQAHTLHTQRKHPTRPTQADGHQASRQPHHKQSKDAP